jgi:hypothetical protein
MQEIVLTLFSGIQNGTLTSLNSKWIHEKEQDAHFLKLFYTVPALKKIFLDTKQIQDNYSKDIEKTF